MSALAGKWPALALLALLAMALLAALEKYPALVSSKKAAAALASAAALLWLCFLALKSLPGNMVRGFDAAEHLRYILFIMQRHTLPLPQAGLETYHPPLFHIASAAVAACWFHVSGSVSAAAMKILPWLCGMGNVTLAWLLAREIFPGQNGKALLAGAFVLLLPMNIYLSAFTTNEIFFSFVAGVAFLMTVRTVRRRESWADIIALGLCCGAAMLSKATVLTMLPIITVFIFLGARIESGRTSSAAAARALAVPAVAIAASGWFYARELIHTGTLVADTVRMHSQWMRPGFHTMQYFTSFGLVFKQPFFAAPIHSFWDNIYATMWGDALCGGKPSLPAISLWDMDFASAVYILAIPVVLLLLAGFLRLCALALARYDGRRTLVFGLTAAALFSALPSMMQIALVLGVYGIKAFYMLFLAGPMAIAAAEGIGLFYEKVQKPFPRYLLAGWLGAFAGAVILAYYI